MTPLTPRAFAVHRARVYLGEAMRGQREMFGGAS